MKTIYKYAIYPQAIHSLNLPLGTEVLSVQEQRGGINVYAMIDYDQSETEAWEFLVYGTGHTIFPPAPISAYTFLGTVSLRSGEDVLHVFYRKVANQHASI